MSNQVNESLRPVASFVVENTSEDLKKLAFLAGHYETSKIVKGRDENYHLVRTLPTALQQAGYQCDEVADDNNNAVADGIFIVKGKSPRTRMVDFINYVKNTNQNVVKIRITDLTTDTSRELFTHEIEVAESAVSVKGASDYIQMSTYVNPRNFQQNVIEIDLDEQELILNETTVMIMDVVGKAKFQIDFILG